MARPRRRPEIPDEPQRKRGGQPGNSNALRHGRYGAEYISLRKIVGFMRRRAILTLGLVRRNAARRTGGPPPRQT